MPNDIPVTFVILEDGKAIRCLHCGAVSYHLRDIGERYCGHCNLFHDDILPRVRHWWLANGPYRTAMANDGRTLLLLRELFYARLVTGQRIDGMIHDGAPALWARVREALNE